MTQAFRREERRYLLPSDQRIPSEEEHAYLLDPTEVVTLLDALADAGIAEQEAYRVRTVYLHRKAGELEGQTRYRLRYYDDGDGWIERKRRIGALVAKRRERYRGDAKARLREGLEPVAEVQYSRRAWQVGGVRITLDEDLSSESGDLGSAVLEVKGGMPDWLTDLLPAEAAAFSKRRWATGRYVA